MVVVVVAVVVIAVVVVSNGLFSNKSQANDKENVENKMVSINAIKYT